MIEAGANPNCTDFDECTPLHSASASANNSIEVVEYLLTIPQVNLNFKNNVLGLISFENSNYWLFSITYF